MTFKVNFMWKIVGVLLQFYHIIKNDSTVQMFSASFFILDKSLSISLYMFMFPAPFMSLCRGFFSICKIPVCVYQWSEAGLLEKYCDGSDHPCRAKCSTAVGHNAAFESLSSMETDAGSVSPHSKSRRVLKFYKSIMSNIDYYLAHYLFSCNLSYRLILNI